MMRRKRLDAKHTLIFTPHFPYNSGRKSGAHTAVLGIGGNVGDTLRRFERLFWYLKRSKRVMIEETSAILKNPPFGYLEQPDFYNAIIRIKTDMMPVELLRFVMHTEKRFGRKRSFKNAPRTLDIDIIFYDACRMDTTRLKLPHPQWHKRDSVTIPMQTMKKVM
jgi:2-amino-4-hydroxy-6-hydroxymethyldihydropteridine diphosphokinase